MKLHENVKEIYSYVKANPEEFKDVEILIQMRYVKAVLTNRAGSAPNKIETEKIVKETCLMPYTDMFIFPDGRIGICCCDNFENTTLADLNTENIKDAWNSLLIVRQENSSRMEDRITRSASTATSLMQALEWIPLTMCLTEDR